MIPVIQDLLPILYSFYNTVFQPVLALGPYPSLAFFSTVLAGIFSIIYWWLLDIEKQEEIKEKINNYQDKMKEARKNDKEDEASNHMKKTLELNQKMMMLNFKPMIATMVFVALIFPWLGSTFAPTVELNQQGNQTYVGEFNYAGTNQSVKVQNNSEITVKIGDQEAKVGEPIKAHGIEWDIVRFSESNGGWFSSAKGTVIKFNAKFVELPFSIPIAGSALNWLGFYIIIAMPLTFIFRKLLGVS